MASMAGGGVPCPVMKMTGILVSISWTRRNVSSPEASGRSMSRMTTSGRSRMTVSTPSAAEEAVRRVTSGSQKAWRKKYRIDGSSSTTSRVGMTPPRYPPNPSRTGNIPKSLRRQGRQAEQEAGASPGQVVSGEAAAVLFGDALGHRQPQPHPGLLAAHEGLEHLGEDVRGDPRAGVADVDFDMAVPGRAEVDFHGAPAGHGIKGVQHQVEQELLQLVLVRLRLDRIVGLEQAEVHLLLLRPARDDREHPVHDIRKVQPSAVRLRRPGEVEERLKGSLHAADLVLDHGQVLGRQAPGRGLPEVNLDQPLARGERVAQLVGDARGYLAQRHHLLGAL